MKKSQAAELRFSELQNVKVSLADKQNFVAFSENERKREIRNLVLDLVNKAIRYKQIYRFL